MIKILKNNIHLVLIFLLSIPAIWALTHTGFYGASDDLHIAWLFEMDKVIKLGQIPPRFVPDLSFGFGYPLFNFVFPLPFYLGEIFHLIGFTLVDSIKIVFGLSLVFSAFTMYFLLKEVVSKEVALAGSLIYLYTPYRSTDVYIRGAIGEALSFVFLPLVALAVIRIYKNLKEKGIQWKNIAMLSLSAAALILSHNIVSYMFFPFLLVLILILFLSLREGRGVFLINSTLGILGALLVSLYFWLPAISESTLMQYGTVFNFADHFPTIRQLVTPFFGYGASVPGPYDGMSFFMGLINLIAIGVGTLTSIFLWKKLRTVEKSILVWALTILGGSFFMMNFRSSFLWENLPLLPYFQFPWRFLTVVTFSSVIFLIPFNYIKGYWRYVTVGLITFGVVALNFSYFKPHDFLERQDNYYIERYIPVPMASKGYLETQEEYLRLPKGTIARPDKNYPIVFSDKKFIYTVAETDGIYSKINLNVPEDMEINYSKYYYPGWVAWVDGDRVEIKTGEPFGQIAVNIPRGEHTLEVNFGETKFRLILNIISGLSIITMIALLFKKK